MRELEVGETRYNDVVCSIEQDVDDGNVWLILNVKHKSPVKFGPLTLPALEELMKLLDDALQFAKRLSSS